MTAGPALRHVAALLAKDFRIHGREIMVTQAGVVALVALAMYLKPASGAARAGLVFNFNLLLAGFWSEWLISREKSKGTFAWLRSTPITDWQLVVSKFAATAACCVSLWTLTSVVFLRADPLSQRPAFWLLLQCVLLAFAGLAVATRWRFGPKLGQVIPYALVFGLALLSIAVSRTGSLPAVDPQILFASSGRQLMLAVAVVGCYALILSRTYAWVRRSDTSALLE
jgi:ABC-type transport system involved in multi-copper enzyme maturation permease subunit